MDAKPTDLIDKEFAESISLADTASLRDEGLVNSAIAVTDSTICDMADKFEHVGGEPWERSGAFNIPTEDRTVEDAVEQFANLLVGPLIWDAALVPLQAPVEAPALVATPRSATHSADLKLRNLVQRTVEKSEYCPRKECAL